MRTSQLLGCTPVGPIGWGIGVGSAAAAVLAVAAAPRLLPARWLGATPAGGGPVGGAERQPYDGTVKAAHTAGQDLVSLVASNGVHHQEIGAKQLAGSSAR